MADKLAIILVHVREKPFVSSITLIEQLTAHSRLVRTLLLGWSLALLCSLAQTQTAPQNTADQAWPEFDVHVQFASKLRLLTLIGTEQGANFPFQQFYTGAGLGYQFKPILRSHLRNIDPDEEHYLLLGGGYEYLRTTNSGRISNEERITLNGIVNFRPPASFLVKDRNWIELRWINGKYSTTYRNLAGVERDFLVHGFKFTPEGSAEWFYDGSVHSWNSEWYTAGVQWPYKNLWMVDTFYRREHCNDCNPRNWNVGGVTLHLFFKTYKSAN
jgi:hypothetical protein